MLPLPCSPSHLRRRSNTGVCGMDIFFRVTCYCTALRDYKRSHVGIITFPIAATLSGILSFLSLFLSPFLLPTSRIFLFIYTHEGRKMLSIILPRSTHGDWLITVCTHTRFLHQPAAIGWVINAVKSTFLLSMTDGLECALSYGFLSSVIIIVSIRRETG